MSTFDIMIPAGLKGKTRLEAIVQYIRTYLEQQTPDKEPPYRSGNPYEWRIKVPRKAFSGTPWLPMPSSEICGMECVLSDDEHFHVAKKP